MKEKNINVSTPFKFRTINRPSKAIASLCKICGVPALYKYYGAIVCHPCKMFFKRNGQSGLETFKCVFTGHCEVNIDNRHVCASCRLYKCFISGMCKEMIRCSRTKKEILKLNQFRSDRLELNDDQWRLISNLVKCYEEHGVLRHVQCFMQEQDNLPLKLRFKMAPVNEVFAFILGGIQYFFSSNRDFLSLNCYDRSILLRYAMENAGSLGAILVLRQIPFCDNLGFLKTAEDIYGPIVMDLTKRLINNIDPDVIFVKLGIAMFAFSTTNCASYPNVGIDHLRNIKNILRIQDMYAEVAWKYLLYRYDHEQAVTRFVNFIRCLLIVINVIIENEHAQHHKHMIMDIIEKADQALNK